MAFIYFITATDILITTDLSFASVSLLVKGGTVSTNVNNSNFMVLDSSTNNAILTTAGAIGQGPLSPFSSGGSITFNGTSGNYLTTPYVTSLYDWWTSDYTVEMWVNIKAHSGSGFPTQFGNGNVSANQNYWSFGTNSTGKILFSYFNGGSIYVTGTTTIPLNTWTHIAMTYSASTIRLWINGVQDISTAISGTPQSTGTLPLYIGQYNTLPYNGYISNIRIVKGTALYTNTFTPSNTPLTAISGTSLLLKCENATFIDSSLNHNLIQYTPIPIGSFGPHSPYWSVLFNSGSSNSMLRTPSNANFNLNSGDWTFECWVHTHSFSDNNNVLLCGDYNNYVNWGIRIGVTTGGIGSVWFGVGFGSWAWGTVYNSNANVIKIGQWQHVAIVRYNSNLHFYVDGVNCGSIMNPPIIGTTAGSIHISSYFGATSPFDGFISNLRLVKGTALYTTNFTPPTSPLTDITGTALLTCQSNTYKDNSSSNLAVTVTGAPYIRPFSPFKPNTNYFPAIHGGSGYFNGALPHFLRSSNQVTLANEFTIEFWINKLDTSDTVLFAIDSGSSNGFAIRYYSGQILVYFAWPSFNMQATSIKLGEWSHLALTRHNGTATLWYNGTSVYTVSTAATPTGYISIGGGISGYVNTNAYFSDVRFVNGTAVYTAPFTPPTSPLTAITNTNLLATFETARIFDATTNNDITTRGGVQLSTTVKKFDSSVYFDGVVGTYLSLPNYQMANFKSGEFTIEFWINRTGGSGEAAVCTTRPNSGSLATPFLIWYTNGTTLTMLTNSTASSWDYNLVISPSLVQNTWYHIAITRQGNTLRTFVNGVVTITQSMATQYQTLTVPTTPILIGSEGTDRPFQGYIEDFRITKGIARYTANFDPPTVPFATK